MTGAQAARPAEQDRPPGRRERLEGRLRGTPALDPVLSGLARDRALGGSLLAGALAFRLFGVLLPLALLVAVSLGYAAAADSTAPSEIGDSIGIGEATLSSVAESSKLASDKAWAVGIFAVVALIYASVKAVRAVHAVQCLAWKGRVEPIAHPLRGGLGMVAAVIAIGLVWAAVGRARAEIGTVRWQSHCSPSFRSSRCGCWPRCGCHTATRPRGRSCRVRCWSLQGSRRSSSGPRSWWRSRWSGPPRRTGRWASPSRS